MAREGTSLRPHCPPLLWTVVCARPEEVGLREGGLGGADSLLRQVPRLPRRQGAWPALQKTWCVAEKTNF